MRWLEIASAPSLAVVPEIVLVGHQDWGGSAKIAAFADANSASRTALAHWDLNPMCRRLKSRSTMLVAELAADLLQFAGVDLDRREVGFPQVLPWMAAAR